MSRVKVKVDFLENHQSLFIQTQKSLHRPTSQSKGCRRLHHPPQQPALRATGSTTTLQTTLINEMLSFYFSRFCLSQSQGSRREREFCSLNLKFRDENEIFFINISGFETRTRFFLSISQGLRRDRDIFFQVSCFEMGLRDEINLILTRILEIANSRYAVINI